MPLKKAFTKNSLCEFFIETPSGQRKINLQSLQEFINNSTLNQKIQQDSKQNFLYARVSSRKQMDDLSRQVEYIKSRKSEYLQYDVITDIASGINFKRKGLSTILESCLQGNIGEVVIAYKDTILRFGYELLEELVTKAGGKITVLDQNINKSSEEEKLDDLLSIVKIVMGKSKYGNKTSEIEITQN